jgi:hypothetical protein
VGLKTMRTCQDSQCPGQIQITYLRTQVRNVTNLLGHTHFHAMMFGKRENFSLHTQYKENNPDIIKDPKLMEKIVPKHLST